jgi:glutamine synthetase
VRVDQWPGIAPLHLVLCDIGQVDGSDWDGCGRTFLRSALERLHRHAGLRVRASFEHEFVLEDDRPPAPAMSLEAQRRAEPETTRYQYSAGRDGLQISWPRL